MDTTKIERAIFGQVNQGFGLRVCSSNNDLFKKASALLDLPDTIAPGINPFPYISGFPLENYYLIARTFPDTHASRSGMVVVYAFAILLEEIIYLDEINQLIDLLPNEVCKEKDFISQELAFKTSVATNICNNSQLQIAELLVEKKSEPIVHIGISDFNESVVSVWALLWLSMRKNFIFRLSLSPKDCIEPLLPHLVCTPESLVGRWNTDYKRIDHLSLVKAVSPAAHALCSNENFYKDFIEKFGIEIKSPYLLRLLVQAHNKYSSNLNDFSEYLSLVRFIEVLSPNAEAGTDGKNHLIDQLEYLINKSKIEEILKLRNVKGNAFNNFEIIWQAITSKIKSHSFVVKEDNIAINLIKDAFDDQNRLVDAWKNSVKLGLSQAFVSQETSVFSSAWRWLEKDPNVVLQLLKQIKITATIENQLVIYAPNHISKTVEDLLIPFLREHHLLQLHGLIVGSQFSIMDAFKQQLAIDTDISFTKGLEAIISRARSSELLEACVLIEDKRITSILANYAIENPKILEKVSLLLPESLSIWAKVLVINSNVWNIPNNAQEILFSLLDEYLTLGDSVHLELIYLLSNTPLADLYNYHKRLEVWNIKDTVLSESFLKQTALGLYERALKLNYMELDQKLERQVYEIPHLIERMKRDSLNNVQGVLSVFSSVKFFTESEFIEWLIFQIEKSSNLTAQDMDSIGQFINRKSWGQAALEVFKKLQSSTSDLKLILNHCENLLPIWERLTIGNVSNDDKWEALLDLLQTLYPKGPDENDIWDRASDKNLWNIWDFASGYLNWRSALKKVRNGSKPHPKDLLREMKSDFPKNERINILDNLF